MDTQKLTVECASVNGTEINSFTTASISESAASKFWTLLVISWGKSSAPIHSILGFFLGTKIATFNLSSSNRESKFFQTENPS